MNKLSFRDDNMDVRANVDSFLDNNLEFITDDVKALFMTLNNLKIAAKNDAIDYLSKTLLKMTKTEAEQKLEDSPNDLEEFESKYEKLVEDWSPKLQSIIEHMVVDRVYDSILSNVNINDQAVAIIKHRMGTL